MSNLYEVTTEDDGYLLVWAETSQHAQAIVAEMYSVLGQNQAIKGVRLWAV